MCCCIPDTPVEDVKGRFRTFNGPNRFQTSMMDAPCADGCSSMLWCCGQFIPFTCGITQYFLRRKVLQQDMSKYQCCQGYINCCCFKAGTCGEENCPDLCLCIEAHCCNGFAVSASRMYVMDKYNLSSDPCDYRLIRISNCLQLLSCVCDIMALIDGNFRECARIVDHIADLFYHMVTGCMTAQVAYEMKYQEANPQTSNIGGVAQTEPYYPPPAAEPVKAYPVYN